MRAITWRRRIIFARSALPWCGAGSSPKLTRKDAPKVVIINQAMASRYWPNEDVIGKRFTFEDNPKRRTGSGLWAWWAT